MRFCAELAGGVGVKKSRAKQERSLAYLVNRASGFGPNTGKVRRMALLSIVGGMVLVAIGSNFIIPIGTAVGGICDLAGIVSMMVFLGLIEGE